MNQRSRVVFVASAPDAAGPAGDVLRFRLDSARFEQVLVFPEEPGPEALRYQHEGAMVHGLGLPPEERRGFVMSTVAVERLARLLKEFGADVAHGLDLAASVLVALAGRIAGVPVLIGTIREHAARAPSWAARRALRALDRIVTASEPLRDEVIRFLAGKHPPIVVLGPATDPRGVRGRARAAEFSEPRLRVGTCAHLAGTGVDDLVFAAALLDPAFPDLEWLVEGTGPDGLRLLRLTQREAQAGRVRLLGDREDLGAFLASLDAYVSPAGADALPAGLLHALAAGVPCVAVSNPTIEAELVDDRDAALVRGPGPVALADAVRRVLDPGAAELRARLQAAGPRAAERPFAAGGGEAVAALYGSLIEEVRHRSR